tara:strand:- start:592 stop:963 length:372 start_codon:yes stop_codon:yes gene_type:complete
MKNKKLLKESWLKMFGEWNKTLLKYMYGDDVKMMAKLKEPELADLMKEDDEDEAPKLKFSITGKKRDVKAYADAIVSEKNYLDAYIEYGKEHPQTVKTREILDQAVREFEGTTGIMWPFKDEE